MIVKKSNTYTVLCDQRDAIQDFAKFLAHKVPTSFKTQNLIIDLLKYEHLTLEQLLLFIQVSNTHRASKHSFVILNTAIDPELIPYEIMVVPTLLEGADVIEMEEIERDLGF
tara:strand:- start:7895 stop:8230 length:336 start_codon:yes stop_codon:yes gene_type:complete